MAKRFVCELLCLIYSRFVGCHVNENKIRVIILYNKYALSVLSENARMWWVWVFLISVSVKLRPRTGFSTKLCCVLEATQQISGTETLLSSSFQWELPPCLVFSFLFMVCQQVRPFAHAFTTRGHKSPKIVQPQIKPARLLPYKKKYTKSPQKTGFHTDMTFQEVAKECF